MTIWLPTRTFKKPTLHRCFRFALLACMSLLRLPTGMAQDSEAQGALTEPQVIARALERGSTATAGHRECEHESGHATHVVA